MPGAGKPGLIRLFAVIAIALASATALGQSKAPDYPNRTIKIIAPVQPGGGVDLVARTIADRLGRGAGRSRSSSRTRAAAAASSDRWPPRARRPTATR